MKNSSRFIREEEQVWLELEKIVLQGYSHHSVFTDWVDLILSSLLSLTDNLKRKNITATEILENKLDGIYEKRYLEILKRYNNAKPKGLRPADYFSAAWGFLAKETIERKSDIIGQLFCTQITHGENGQFFTPQNVSDMMAEMTIKKQREKLKVCDCACGSGRLLISASKINSENIFYGTDIDARCAKMAVINMYLFNLEAFIFLGNALTLEFSKAWTVKKGGFVDEWTENEIKHLNLDKTVFRAKTDRKGQGLLFF